MTQLESERKDLVILLFNAETQDDALHLGNLLTDFDDQHPEIIAAIKSAMADRMLNATLAA